MRNILFSVLLLTTACGDPTPEMSFATTIQWAPQIACLAGKATLGADMVAILEIGGHDPCTLEVNADTLESSGVCEQITIGIVRPLALGYRIPNPADELVDLAYIIGSVDLSKETLGTRTNVDVNLVPDGVTGVEIYTDDEFTALPGEDDCASLVDEVERTLCISEAWAANQLSPPIRAAADFDIDNDTEPNLVEACNGTLFD